MSTSTALLEVLEQLKKEREQTQAVAAPLSSWAEYRQWQEMWNPNWSVAGEMIYPSNPV